MADMVMQVTTYALHRTTPDGQTSPMPVVVERLGNVLRHAAVVVRRVIGVPDYERYVAHVREKHPGREPMSREDFERVRLEDKYSRPGQRCC